MLEHRLRDWFASPAAVAAAPTPAFVPCPGFAVAMPGQLAFVAEVYRLARELTAAQLKEAAAARPWPPAFSLN